jgi:hypothetical protein
MRSLLWNLMDAAARVAFGARLEDPTPRETELAAEMRDRVGSLPPLDQLDSADSWWRASAGQFRTHMSAPDPRDFTRWPVVRNTMFLGNRRQAMVAWRYLKSLPDFETRWRPAIDEVPLGAPVPLLWSRRTSGQMAWIAFGAAAYERLTGLRLQDRQTIIEWGGGYGSMCRLVHRMGFRGRYLIYDLPELSILQRYYLRSLGLSVLDEEAWLSGKSGILLLSGLENLARVVPLATSAEAAFWATWSLSETPKAVREKILPHVAQMGSYLISYQGKAADADNLAYFEAWRRSTGPDWQHWVEPVAQSPQHYWSAGRRLVSPSA